MHLVLLHLDLLYQDRMHLVLLHLVLLHLAMLLLYQDLLHLVLLHLVLLHLVLLHLVLLHLVLLHLVLIVLHMVVVLVLIPGIAVYVGVFLQMENVNVKAAGFCMTLNFYRNLRRKYVLNIVMVCVSTKPKLMKTVVLLHMVIRICSVVSGTDLIHVHMVIGVILSTLVHPRRITIVGVVVQSVIVPNNFFTKN